MNSKMREFGRVELYVTAEELHFLAHAATEAVQRLEGTSKLGASQNCAVRLCTNHLQELSMRLRAMEVAPSNHIHIP